MLIWGHDAQIGTAKGWDEVQQYMENMVKKHLPDVEVLVMAPEEGTCFV